MKKFSLIVIIAVAFFYLSPILAQNSFELLEQGRDAFMNYDFQEASRLYSLAKKKSKASDELFAEQYDNYSQALKTAENFLERVEKISVIDSITVPKEGFFKAYRLPVSSGVLGDGSALPRNLGNRVNYVFTNERDDYKLWSASDTTGILRIMESTKLTDGDWSSPAPLDSVLFDNGDAAYPFLMSDGVTLYYADNGENSIGGYDIMVAVRDAADGSFMQPSNLGFPYNSPYDDYLLAIDELNGVGWWATDRNQLDDELTVYVFVVNDLRENYPPDFEDIISFARIDDYITTQPEDADYDNLLATIRAIETSKVRKKDEFFINAPGGIVYRRFDELPNVESKSKLRLYLASKDSLDKAEENLLALRKKYAATHSSEIAARIKKEEISIETQRRETAETLSQFYKTLR